MPASASIYQPILLYAMIARNKPAACDDVVPKIIKTGRENRKITL
jgi:hypothetical protein